MNENERLKEEVLERWEDLKFEYGEDELSEVRILEKLRDEFKDEQYRDVLIDLGIIEEDLGIEEVEDLEDEKVLDNLDNEDKSVLINKLLGTAEHIRNIDKRIRGYEEVKKGVWKKKVFINLPIKERIKILSFLEAIYLPQNIVSDKKLSIAEFESRMNYQLNQIRVRLENYPDDIVKSGTIKYIIGILLNEVSVVLNAIENGNLGRLTSEILVGTFNEKSEVKPELTKDDIAKALFEK